MIAWMILFLVMRMMYKIIVMLVRIGFWSVCGFVWIWIWIWWCLVRFLCKFYRIRCILVHLKGLEFLDFTILYFFHHIFLLHLERHKKLTPQHLSLVSQEVKHLGLCLIDLKHCLELCHLFVFLIWLNIKIVLHKSFNTASQLPSTDPTSRIKLDYKDNETSACSFIYDLIDNIENS